jgi:hypothetical protein
MFHLNSGFSDSDFFCPFPECGKPISVEWTTEYGDASVGSHDGKCPHCNKLITFEVTISYGVGRRE